MYRSNSSSSLVLLALDKWDAEQWQQEHFELADDVYVVMVGHAFDFFCGRIVSAYYWTASAALHPKANEAIEMLRRSAAKTKPERDYVVADRVEPMAATGKSSRFLHERFTVSDVTSSRGSTSKQIGLVAWSPQFGMLDAIAVEARLRRRFAYLAAKALRADPTLRPVVRRIEVEQVGAHVQAWVTGSVEFVGAD